MRSPLVHTYMYARIDCCMNLMHPSGFCCTMRLIFLALDQVPCDTDEIASCADEGESRRSALRGAG